MQTTTSSALALVQQPGRSGRRRMLVKRVGVAVVAAAFAGSLVLPAGLQVAAAEQQQLDPSIALLLEQRQQTVVAAQSELVSAIAQQGLSATTPEQLAEAREAAAAAEQARQDEAAAAEAEATPAAAAETASVAQDAPVSAAGGGIVGIAQSQLGVPYVWGGASPATGFDCSGFTQWVYAQVGVSLPHSDRGQYGMGTSVSPSQVQPGDLIVWSGHTAIYVGNDTIIHSPTAGSTVKYTSYSAMIGAMGTPYVGRF